MQDIYIVASSRTPFGRYRGKLAQYCAIGLGELALKDTLAKAKLQPSDIDALYMGNVLSAGLGQNMARQIAINVGMDQKSIATTINEVCGSSLKAVRFAQAQMLIGDLGIVAVGGSESMSNAELLLPKSEKKNPEHFRDEMMVDGLTDAFSNKPMGLTAEKVAEWKNISRKQADEFSMRSHQKAAIAIKSGALASEIAPVMTDLGEVDQDENVRFDSSMEQLSKLKPVFKQDGQVTAGSASPLSDGASMVILATKQKVDELNLTPLAKLGAYAEVGFDPSLMGYTPKFAIAELLNKTNTSIDDYDLFEINEAFAATTLAVQKDLNIPDSKLNINGGAIALGHPLGATGTRLLGTMAHNLHNLKRKKGIVSLCIGGGLAIAYEVKNVTL